MSSAPCSMSPPPGWDRRGMPVAYSTRYSMGTEIRCLGCVGCVRCIRGLSCEHDALRRSRWLSALPSSALPAAATAQLRTQLVATGLTNPVAFVDGSARPLDVLCGRTARHHPHASATTRCRPALFLDSDRRLHPGGERGLARARVPARRTRRRGASTSTSPTPTATPWSRVHAHRRRAPSIRLALRSDCGPTAAASSSSRSRTTTAATSRSAPTAISTSAWATAAAAAIR